MTALRLAAGLCLWSLLAGTAVLPAAGEEDGATGGDLTLKVAAPVEAWRVLVGDPLSGPPVGDDKGIYAATDRGRVVAVGLDGKELWKIQAGGGEGESFSSSPLPAGDTLVIGSRHGSLYAFDIGDGGLRWTYDVGGPIFGTAGLLPARGGRRSVMVLSQEDGTVHRVDLQSGKRIMVSAATNRCDGPAAVRGGTIAYGNCDAALYVLSAEDLAVRKKIALREAGQVYAGVLLTDERIYAGDRSGRLYAADLASGRILWVNEESRGDVSSAPVLHGERIVYSSDDGDVSSLDRGSGRALWRSPVGGRPKGPVITGGGQILVSSDGALFLLGPDDGSVIWSREISDEITSPAVIGGLIVVGSDDGFIVAFRAGGGGAEKE